MKNSRFKNFSKMTILVLVCMFTTISGVFAQNSGSVDPSFTLSGVNFSGISLVQPLNNGQMLVAGANTQDMLTKVNSNGTVDTSFNTQVGLTVLGLDTLPNGTIVYKGYNNQGDKGIYYVSSNHDSVYSYLQVFGNDYFYSPGFKYIDGNTFDNPQPFSYLAYILGGEIKLASTDTASPYLVILPLVSSSMLPNCIVSTFKIKGDKIYVGTNRGLFRFTLHYPTAYASPSDVVFNTNSFATFDTSNVVQNPCEIRSIAFQSTGSIVVGGYFKLTGGIQSIFITKLDSTAIVDNSFISIVDNVVWDILVEIDDHIVIAGNFTMPTSGISGLMSDGTEDIAFNTNSGVGATGPNPYGRVVQKQNGKLLIGGYFSAFDGFSGRLVRLFGEENLNSGICFCSADSVGSPQIIWEKANTTLINYYKIYKFGIGGWSAIDSVPYANNWSYYTDITSNQNQSEKYALSTVDTLGVEGPMSSNVTTLFLQNSQGSLGENNLTWNPGAGFEILYFRIVRLDVNFLDVPIDSVAFDSSVVTYAWTDFNPPLGVNTYTIIGISTANCNPTFNKGGVGFSESRSNPIHVLSTGIETINSFGDIQAYPNPTTGDLFVKYNLLKSSKVDIKLCNITGSLIKTVSSMETTGTRTVSMDLSSVAPGFYFLKVSTPTEEKVVKIAKN